MCGCGNQATAYAVEEQPLPIPLIVLGIIGISTLALLGSMRGTKKKRALRAARARGY